MKKKGVYNKYVKCKRQDTRVVRPSYSNKINICVHYEYISP